MKNDNEWRIKKLVRFDDQRGSIYVLEEPSLPFIVKRFFITIHTQGERGSHAHIATKQLLICIKGSVEVHAIGRHVNFELSLNSPDTALYIPPKTWVQLKKITKDSIILVLASEPYEFGDYISNFDKFISIINQGDDSS